MKKQLLFMLSVLLFTATLQAQNKVWDFSTNPQLSSQGALSTETVEVDGLTFNAVSGSYGPTRDIPSTTTWADDPTFVPTKEWPAQGSSQGTAVLPARRFFSFPVTGPATIKVWFRVNGTGARTSFISDGTTVLASGTNEVATQGILMTGSYTGTGAGTIYVFQNQSVNYQKIEVAATLGVGDIATSTVSANVHAVGNRIYVSNVKSATEVNIYSITGALVKSLKTNENMDFAFSSGLYIATVKTSEGQKSVKLVTK